MSNTGASPGPSVQEYSIRVPKNSRKNYHVMRFNSVLNVDFSQWGGVKMERENNLKHFKFMKEEQPKFGAGSEYGREAREEARRKKFGIVTKQYKVEDQPWILKVGGKTGKKFKGIREGGVAENTAYYVFTHAANGGIEAYPLNEWYNFQPIQRYKALSAEEAEQEFGRRNRVMNYFSLMLKKRLKNDEDGEEEEMEEGKSKKGGRKSKDFKISEMDDWVESDEDNTSSEDEKGDEDGAEKKEKNKKGKKNQKKENNKKKKGSDESAFEESDDGDEEGRELDYISDSSDSESDIEAKAVKEMKGVAEENALRKLLTSDEDSEEEEKKEEEKGEEKETKEGENAKEKENSKKRKRKKKENDKKGDSSSDSSADSSDSEAEKTKDQPDSASPSPSEKILSGASSTLPKKPRLELSQAPLSFGGENGITEEAVRRYLMRKPMTVTELLQKFKGRKTGLNSDQLVNVMAQILKRINPIKQTIKHKMYLSIKPQ